MDWLVSSFPGENIFTFRKMLRLSVILVHLAKWGGRENQRVPPCRADQTPAIGVSWPSRK